MRTIIQIAVSLATAAVMLSAAIDTAGQPPAPVKREIIPGSELMTSQERERYRQRIRGAKTPQDEEKIRADHKKQMQERARLRGLRLADPAAGVEGPK
jgi:hypothetical protein